MDNPLGISIKTYEFLECFHIAGFALAIGMTTLVDFRLLGLGLRKESPERIARAFEWWFLGGLVVAVFTGFLIFSTDPDMYSTNWSFLIKMASLVIAILFNYTIHRRAIFEPWARGAGRAAACVSLALWVAVIFGGVFIAEVRPGL